MARRKCDITEIPMLNAVVITFYANPTEEVAKEVQQGMEKMFEKTGVKIITEFVDEPQDVRVVNQPVDAMKDNIKTTVETMREKLKVSSFATSDDKKELQDATAQLKALTIDLQEQLKALKETQVVKAYISDRDLKKCEFEKAVNEVYSDGSGKKMTIEMDAISKNDVIAWFKQAPLTDIDNALQNVFKNFSHVEKVETSGFVGTGKKRINIITKK